MTKEFENDSRNWSNIHTLIGTHSKSVNNYAKEGNTRQFQLPRDPAADESERQRWKRALLSRLDEEAKGSRNEIGSWLMPFVMDDRGTCLHHSRANPATPFTGEKKEESNCPLGATSSSQTNTSQDPFRTAKAIEIEDCYITMHQ